MSQWELVPIGPSPERVEPRFEALSFGVDVIESPVHLLDEVTAHCCESVEHIVTVDYNPELLATNQSSLCHPKLAVWKRLVAWLRIICLGDCQVIEIIWICIFVPFLGWYMLAFCFGGSARPELSVREIAALSGRCRRHLRLGVRNLQ
jgi:hypothetical protein